MVEKYKLKWRENYHAELPPPTGPLEKEGFTLIEEPVDENEVDENKVDEDESEALVNSSPRNAAPAHNSCIDSPAPSVGDQSIGSPDDLSPGTRKVRRLA